MKRAYWGVGLIFTCGIGLFIFGINNTEEQTVLDLSFHPRAVTGLGVITMILSALGLMSVAGNR